MQEDSRGLPLTASNQEAARHLERAIESFNYWKVDVMDHLGAALEADPDCPFAHAFKGLFPGRRAKPRSTRAWWRMRSMRPAPAWPASRLAKRLYIEALELAASGRLMAAAQKYETILNDHPTDLLAHRLVQQEYFWMGNAANMRDVVERAAPAWDEETSDYSMFLSCRAFSNEEALDYQAAERHGRKAIELDPGDTWAAHAMAHVLVMQGRVDEGVDWLEGLKDNWGGKNQIVHHLWWHLCLFLLEWGDHARILEHYDAWIRNPDSPLVKAVPDAYIDLQNIASLLLRLELRGVDVGGRWQAVAGRGGGADRRSREPVHRSPRGDDPGRRRPGDAGQGPG